MKFLAVELHGAVLESCRAQLLCQTVELNECVGILATVSALRCWRSRIARSVHHTVVLEQLLHLLVGVAAVRLYHGVNDAVFLHVGIIVEIEDDGECQLLLVGAQRADEVAQTFWQHRNGAVDEVYTRGTLHRLLVYHRTLLDVVAHVGNVYAYFPKTVIKLLYRQGVVEVLGVLRVDSACEGVAEVLAFGIVFGRNLSRNLLCSLLHVLRILVRQSVLCEDSVHLYVVVASLAQHVHHLANHVAMILIGPFHDVHHCVVAVLAALQLAARNDDAVGKHVGW